MNHGRSFTIASVALLALYIVSYLIHAAVGGTFALPPAVLAVLTPATPVLDYVLAYVIHGLATGSWDPPLPLLPQGNRPAPEPPPAPPQA